MNIRMNIMKNHDQISEKISNRILSFSKSLSCTKNNVLTQSVYNLGNQYNYWSISVYEIHLVILFGGIRNYVKYDIDACIVSYIKQTVEK